MAGKPAVSYRVNASRTFERAEGVAWVVEAIEKLLPHAEQRGVVLVMENHYKDGYWQYPEFAQASDVFLEIIEQIDSPWFRRQLRSLERTGGRR